jgi:transcriptional regulator with XRE-family HTH domain
VSCRGSCKEHAGAICVAPAAGTPQEAFADLIGFHRTYVGGEERGERNLTLKGVERIAERLGLDALGLLPGPRPTPQPS